MKRKPQPTKSVAWCFTINFKDNEDTGAPFTVDEVLALQIDPSSFPDCSYAVWQLERGHGDPEENVEGTLHFQGYLKFDKGKRITQISKMMPRAAIYKANGSPGQCTHYCSKPIKGCDCGHCTGTGLRVAGTESGPWSHGSVKVTKGTRSDMVQIKELVDAGATQMELYDAHFGTMVRNTKGIMNYKRLKTVKRNWKPIILVFWGPSGTGKSHRVRQQFPDHYRVPAPKSATYYDDYDGQDVILFEEFTPRYMTYSFIKQLLDEYEMVLPVHGGAGHQCIARTYVFTSNKHPRDWYDSVNNRNVPEYADSPLKRRLDDWGTIVHMNVPWKSRNMPLSDVLIGEQAKGKSMFDPIDIDDNARDIVSVDTLATFTSCSNCGALWNDACTCYDMIDMEQ